MNAMTKKKKKLRKEKKYTTDTSFIPVYLLHTYIQVSFSERVKNVLTSSSHD